MYTAEYLDQFTRNVFEKMGCSPEDAKMATDVFIAAELRGYSSHGMIRIKDYFQLWQANRINVKPDVRIVHESPSTAVVDGDGAIGMIAATKSMEVAIEKAKTADSLWFPLEGLTKSEKSLIVQRALNKARGIKSNIEWHITDHETKREWLAKHEVAWHKKFTLSFACLVLFFIGAPLGAIIRKGGIGLPVVVSVLFFVLFHIITITGEKSAIAGAVRIELGMWIASAVLLPLGIFLTIKATSDSPLLDFDIWKRRFGKLFRKNI